MTTYKGMKYELVNNAINRAKSGLDFLEECIECFHTGGTDPAYSRSLYIIFSYSFELILKSKLILGRNETEKEKLLKGINSHDLEKLSRELSSDALGDISVKNIHKKQDADFIKYEVEITDGRKIRIDDLVDVRDDFEKDALRQIDANEANRMREEIRIFREMVSKITSENGNSNF